MKEDIRNTDIGSFKFIARTFDTELEQAVKWFIIVIVIVFDPMAVTLVIAYNVMLLRMNPRRKKIQEINAQKEKEKSEIKAITKEIEKEIMDDPEVEASSDDDETTHVEEHQGDIKETVDNSKSKTQTNSTNLPEESIIGSDLNITDVRKLQKAIPALKRFKGNLQKLVEEIWQRKKEQ